MTSLSPLSSKATSREEIKLHLLLSRLEEILELLSSSSSSSVSKKRTSPSIDFNADVQQPSRLRLHFRAAEKWLKALEKHAQ